MNRGILLLCVGAALVWSTAFVATAFEGRYAAAFAVPEKGNDDRIADEIVSVRGILRIAYRNSKAVLYNALGGLSAGIYTALNLAVNGGSLGFYVGLARERGLIWSDIAAYILPHFAELLALWISGGVGFAAAGLFFRWLRSSTPPDPADFITLAVMMGVSEMFVLMGAVWEVFVSVGIRTL